MYNLHKQILIQQGYEPLDLLGKGSFSSVYTIRNLKTKKLLAVKIIENYLSLLFNKNDTECIKQSLDKIRKLNCHQNNFKYFNREVAILKRLIQSYHPSIVKILNIKQTFLYSYIYMEHLNNGNLRDFLNKNGPLKPDEILAKLWIYQLSSALNYLHSIGIAHRDIKLQNIGLNDKMNVKLIDFGFACKCLLNKSITNINSNELINFVDSNKIQKSISCIKQKNDNSINKQTVRFSMSQCGTPLFIPPEIIIADKFPYDPRKADIWSLGVSMFTIISHRYPFTKKDYKFLYKQQLKSFWIKKRVYSCFSYDAFDLLINMLNPFPEKRIQASEILKHNWIQKNLDEILFLQNQSSDLKVKYFNSNHLQKSIKTMKNDLIVN